MTDARLHIERLRIRVRGATPEATRAAVEGIGPELLRRLLPHLGAHPARSAAVTHVDLGTQRAGADDPAGLRAAIADSLASGVRARFTGAEGGKE